MAEGPAENRKKKIWQFTLHGLPHTTTTTAYHCLAEKKETGEKNWVLIKLTVLPIHLRMVGATEPEQLNPKENIGA